MPYNTEISFNQKKKELAKERSKPDEVGCKSLLAEIPCLPQRQDSLLDQMQDLYHVANKLGLCDAADRLRYQFNLS